MAHKLAALQGDNMNRYGATLLLFLAISQTACGPGFVASETLNSSFSSVTPTISLTPTRVPTATPTPTTVPSSTPTPTASPTSTPSGTPIPSSTPTATPTTVPSSTPAPTVTPLPTASPTSTPAPSSTPSPTPVIDIDPNSRLCDSSNPSQIKSAAQRLRIGEWTSIQALNQNFTATVTSTRDTDYADSASWNPANQCIYFTGAGHNSYPRHYSYCLSTNTWQRLSIPGYGNSTSLYSYFTHAYDSNAIDTENQIHYTMKSGKPYAYDIKTGVWNNDLPRSPVDSISFGGTSQAYYKDLGLFAFLSDSGSNRSTLTLYNPRASSWSTIFTSNNYHGNHPVAEYNITSDVLVFGGGQNGHGRTFYKYQYGRSVTRIADALATTGSNTSEFIADPVTGNFILITQSSTPTVYEYQVNLDSWRSIGSAPSALQSDGNSYRPTISVAIPELQVIAIIDGRNSNIYLYKSGGSTCQ